MIGERPVAERRRLLLRHQQHGRGAVGERRGVAGGDRAVAAVEHRLSAGQRLERGVGADAVVARDRLVHRGAAEPGRDLRGRAGRRRSAAAARWWLRSASWSCSSRLMPFSFAIFSADWPIVSPVEGSAIAGVTGTRSRGRVAAEAPRPGRRGSAPGRRSTSIRLKRRECRIGMSESDSTPPARMVSAWPEGDLVGGVGDGLGGGGAGAVQRVGRNAGGELGQETHLARRRWARAPTGPPG